MKVIRFLCGFCFLVIFSCPSFAQRGGGGLGGGLGDLPCLKCPPPDPIDPSVIDGCPLTWNTQGLSQAQPGISNFTGTGTASANITAFQGNNINGWVNYVVEGTIGNTTPTYEMILELATIPYKIVYKAPKRENAGYFNGQPIYLQQYGLLEVHVSNMSIYSIQLSGTENRVVFRIAREGNVMRFYKNDNLIPTPTITANVGGNARVAVGADSDGRIRVSLFSPLCQQLIPSFNVSTINCTSGTGQLSVSSVQGGTAPYFHYFDNLTLNTIFSIPSPTVGWITTVDQSYRASTYYMGVGKDIIWQHTGTQLNGNIVTSTSSNGFALPTNTLSTTTDGWIGFRKESNIGWIVSFVDATTSTPLYEFRARDGLRSDVYVGGVFVKTVQSLLTDYLRISREGNAVKFYVNEVNIHTQVVSNALALKAKFGFTTLGSTISYPTLSFCSPIAPPVITLAATNLSTCQYENVPVITPTTQNVTELRWYSTNPNVVPRPAYTTGSSFDPDGASAGSLAAGTYTYYVTGIDLNGQETASQAITLTVHTRPDFYIRPIDPLCPGSSANLEIITSIPLTGATYQWYKNNILLVNQISSSLTITGGGIYKVEVSLPQGCIITKIYNAGERVMPTLTLNYENGIGCGYTTLRATISGGYTVYYVEIKNSNGIWTSVGINGVGPNRNQFTLPAQPHIPGSGTYRIYYQDIISGCKSYSNELAVTVHSLPQTTLYSAPVCQGNPVTLTIHNYNSSSYTYLWQQQVSGSWENVGTTQSISVPYVSGTTTSNFQVITTNLLTGCSTTTSRSVYYAPSPSITYIPFKEAEIGETVHFNVAQVGTAINYIYHWTGPNNYSSAIANPDIPVTINSYGEYVLVVSNAGCQTTYRAIIAEKGIFATLKENLDASYYHTNRSGKLYFKFDEKYGVGSTGLASVSIFNYDYQEVAQRNLSKEYGYNWYGLDLSSFAAIEGDQYVLHIRDELDRRYVLRVKYVTGNNKVIISEDSEICISDNSDRRSIRLDAKSYVDSSPYSIKWYSSTDPNKIDQLKTLSNTERENLLFAEETGLYNQSSSAYFETNQYYLNPTNTTTSYAPGEGRYYVRSVITDFCGNETYSNTITVEVYIGTGCRLAANEITPEKKHRFQVIFSIRRLFSPKPDTNPTVR